MLLDLLILLISTITITSLGLLIFARNYNQPSNQFFAFLSISLVFWTVSNYFSDHATTHILLFTRLTIFGAVLAIYSMMLFMSYLFNRQVFKRRGPLIAEQILTIALLPISFLSQFISSVTVKASGGTVNTSYLYWIFIFYVLYSLILLLVIIVKQYKSVKSALEKQQVSLIAWGLIIYAVLVVFSNVILPLIDDNWSSSRFGPAFTLIFLLMIGYTIVKHRLFDIHLIVARSAAYILSIGFITLIFSLSIVGVSDLTQKAKYSHNIQQIVLLTITL
ncbi:MAG TPA: histidine kinase N-terminal 7TM domain-containing protein, partial [Candidatus Saccharimonadales bacterium]